MFGSQAILGAFPEAPDDLRTSIEVNMQPKNRPDAVDAIDGALGELSRFHQAHGFYVHGVAIASAVLPRRWEERVVPVSDPVKTRGHIGWCVEAHDLAAAKLVAWRERDRNFVRVLLAEDMIDARTLLKRLRTIDVDEPDRDRRIRWVQITAQEL